MASKEEKRVWELPHLREAHQFPGVGSDFWSVKFYPYTVPGLDPVFALVGGKRILVCRPPSKNDTSSHVEIIRLIIDGDPDERNQSVSDEPAEANENYTCAWSKDITTGAPLLCVSGNSAKIKIINVVTGEVVRTLIGHGGEVNDLAVSPINPHILASASEDCTVRIWSLDPAHENQPCAALLEGDGHKAGILTVAFHNNGRYLLSGGIDHVINLWTLPVFPDINTGTNKPTKIFYPHFSTSEIHEESVDCVAFHGDTILSKAANENNIVLWSITTFDSAAEPPSPDTAPTTHDLTRDTRSAFIPHATSTSTSSHPLYTRIIQFGIPDSEIMWMRFSLFPGWSGTSPNPVLAICNKASKVSFWDLSRLENYQESVVPLQTDPDNFILPQKHPFLQPFQRRNRKGGGGAIGRLNRRRSTSPTDSTYSQVTASSNPESEAQSQDLPSRGRKGYSLHHQVSPKKEIERSQSKDMDMGKIDLVKTKKVWEEKYGIGDPSEELQAHHTEVVKGLGFTGRQVAWSSDGRWCVVVGSVGVVACFQRWKD